MANDEKKVPIPSWIPNTLAPEFRSHLQTALLHAHSKPVERLLRTLSDSISASGWEKEVESYLSDRVREEHSYSGAAQDHAKNTLGHDIDKQNDTRPRQRRPFLTQRQQAQLRIDMLKIVVNATRPRGTNQDYPQAAPEGGSNTIALQQQSDKIRMPSHVVESAIRVLKEELKKICYVDDDAYLDLRLSWK